MQTAGSHTFFSNSFFIFVTRFFPLLANLLVIIFFSRLLDASVYGAYQNFWIQLYLLNPIACMGVHVLIVTYAPPQLAGIIKKIKPVHFFLFFGWLTLVSAVFAFFRWQASGITWFIPFFFLLSYAASLIAESVLIAFKKFGALIFISTSYALCYGLLHWFFLKGSFDAGRLFGLLALLIFFKLCLYGFIAWKSIYKEAADTPANYSFQSIRSLWAHLGLYDVSQMVFRWADKFIISLLLAQHLSAIYFNGSIDIPFLSVILGAVGSAALIQLAANKNADTSEYTIAISNYSSRILSSIVFPLFFFFLFFSKELFTVILSDKYLPSVPVFSVAILTMPLYAYHLTAILQNRHKGVIINIGALLDLVIALALMYPLYRLLGLPGVALSIVISSYVQAVFYLYHTGRVLKVKVMRLLPLTNWLIKLIVFFLLFITIHYLLSEYFSEQIVLFLGGSIAVVAVAVSLVAELRISKRKYGNALSRA